VSTQQDKSPEAQALLYSLEEQLHALFQREHAEIRDELSQMGLVVSDAIKTLVSSLNSLSGQLKEQNELMPKIASTSDDGEKEQLQQNYQALSEMVNKEITAVVRSFQFEDIVQQLVSHCQTRSDGLEQLVNQLNGNVKKIKKTGQGGYESILLTMQTDVARVRKELEKENPVKQTSMGEGGIELF